MFNTELEAFRSMTKKYNEYIGHEAWKEYNGRSKYDYNIDESVTCTVFEREIDYDSIGFAFDSNGNYIP